MYDLIIRNGMVYDGSGKPGFRADIAIKDGIIKIVGVTEEDAKTVIDADGKQVTPGVIDMHSHGDLSVLQYPDAESALGQGITTVFTGHCGMGMAPIGKYWKTQGDDLFAMEAIQPLTSVGTFPGRTVVCLSEQMRKAYQSYFGIEMDWTSFGEYMDRISAQGVGVNMVMLVGYQQIRQQVLGADACRPAAEAEICRMEELVEESMRDGAFGLSIGYDYSPDKDATSEELDRMALVVKKYNGIVAAHTRNGKDGDSAWMPIDGYREFLELGLRTGVPIHISHIHYGYAGLPKDRYMCSDGNRRVLSLVEEYRKKGVRVTWDVLVEHSSAFYYHPELCSSLIYYILSAGGKEPFATLLQDETYRAWIIGEISAGKHIVFPRLDPQCRIIRCKNRNYLEQTLAELAEKAHVTVAEMLIHILSEDMDTLAKPVLPYERYKDDQGQYRCGLEFTRSEEACIGTDNCLFHYDYEGHQPGLPHFPSTPTSYHGFVRYLLDEEDVPFETSIRRLTGNAADALGFTQRGYLREGQAADIVILDRERLNTNLNYEDPRRQPVGIEYVIVNGVTAIEKGVLMHTRSGQVFRKRNSMSEGKKRL